MKKEKRHWTYYVSTCHIVKDIFALLSGHVIAAFGHTE